MVTVPAARYVTIELASTLTGYTPSAMRTKISRGVWLEGREWVRAPDGHVLIDMRGYERWVYSAQPKR
ncbi:excisionase [Piscinibacter koreensis]|uniref:Excisionase n=1 Tax=Piscinibacter koreensis TaxID=2742824 RepID=A0A7Y6NQS9_9BURK|nr:excisionase [Schlegelella koreensis]NUZ07620.1 excisionase [Schlegelella koreensis]